MANIFQFSMLGNPTHIVSYVVQTQKIELNKLSLSQCYAKNLQHFKSFWKLGSTYI